MAKYEMRGGGTISGDNAREVVEAIRASSFPDKKRLPYTLQIARRNFSRLFHGVCNALAGPFFSPSMGFNGGITAFRRRATTYFTDTPAFSGA